MGRDRGRAGPGGEVADMRGVGRPRHQVGAVETLGVLDDRAPALRRQGEVAAAGLDQARDGEVGAEGLEPGARLARRGSGRTRRLEDAVEAPQEPVEVDGLLLRGVEDEGGKAGAAEQRAVVVGHRLLALLASRPTHEAPLRSQVPAARGFTSGRAGGVHRSDLHGSCRRAATQEAARSVKQHRRAGPADEVDPQHEQRVDRPADVADRGVGDPPHEAERREPAGEPERLAEDEAAEIEPVLLQQRADEEDRR
jgi:hypothetical protein